MSPAILATQTVGIVPEEAEMGAVFTITHPKVFETLPAFNVSGDLIWIRSDVKVIEMIQVVHKGTVIRGYGRTVARNWPEGNEITVIGLPWENAGYTTEAHECPTCGRIHDSD